MGKHKTFLRAYADTSVFGGVFDKEFEKPSKKFFEVIKTGEIKLLTSELVRQEIQAGPQRVQAFFEEMLLFSEIVGINEAVMDLQKGYIHKGIVAKKYATDAMHVALATVAGARVIVSWNFKHIVNFQKIPMYNAVNASQGYHLIGIYSPLEVIEYEN
jgi:predicted nucleic acid-binding protein